MKNKLGFTLIELILVIAILGVVSIVITINLTQTLKDAENKECTDFKKEVEDAACVYVGLTEKEISCDRSTGCSVPLKLLVKSGLLTSETDPCTEDGAIEENKIVEVSWDDNGQKICKYEG